MKEQLKRGKKHEAKLDDYFSDDWEIVGLSRSHERKGLGDRVFINRQTSEVLLVEYKSDETATRTGNAFVETISVDTQEKPGWVHTCQADYIFYYLPLDSLIYILKPETLRKHLPRWQDKHPTRPTAEGTNKGYQTWGVLVPLCEFEKVAAKVLNL